MESITSNWWMIIIISLISFVLITIAMGLFSGRNHFVLKDKTILITGGSQGMGLGLAKICASKGAHVVIVARTVSKLETALASIKIFASHPNIQRFHYISADLTDANESIRVLEETRKWNNELPPDVVWANAGSAYPHLFIETPIATLRSQMDIDYWAAAYLAHATMKMWTDPTNSTKEVMTEASSNITQFLTAAQPRHFIITSSVVAFLGLAGYSPYSPAKAALRNLADSLSSEMALYNGARHHSSSPLQIPPMRTSIIFPSSILSPGFEAENKVKHPVTVMLESDDVPQSEDDVARIAIQGLEKGEYLVTTSWLGYLMKCGCLAGSKRNGLGVGDWLMGWVAVVAWWFINWDLEKKVFNMGREKHIR